jgi:hypothetical protein
MVQSREFFDVLFILAIRQAVLAGASSREGTLCCQAVFALLDTLQRWHEDAKSAAQAALTARAKASKQAGEVDCLIG